MGQKLKGMAERFFFFFLSVQKPFNNCNVCMHLCFKRACNINENYYTLGNKTILSLSLS